MRQRTSTPNQTQVGHDPARAYMITDENTGLSRFAGFRSTSRPRSPFRRGAAGYITRTRAAVREKGTRK
jgi:hypothetical protein